MPKHNIRSALNHAIACCTLVLMLALSGCQSMTPDGLRQGYLKLLHDHYNTATNPLDASGVDVALSVSVDKADRSGNFDAEYGDNLPWYTQAVMDLAVEKLLPNAASIKRFDAGVEDPSLADKIGFSDVLVEITQASEKAHIGLSEERTLTVRVRDIKGNKDIAFVTYTDTYSEFSLFTDDFAIVFGKVSAALNGRKLRDLIAHPDPSNIETLLVVENVTQSRAMEINQALVAAKSITLPRLLEGDKTSELLDLQVKIEQTMVLLEHKAEMAKEHAEAAVAENAPPEKSRELALIFQERIAILNHMLGEIKEEIANRKR